MNRETDIRFLKGVGEKRAQILHKMGIDTVGALLRFYPRAYEDWNTVCPINDCGEDRRVCVKARIVTPIDEHFVRTKMTLYKFVAQDDAGTRMTVTIFNNKYLARSLHEGCVYLFYGKISELGFHPSMSSPEIRPVESVGIHPVYPANANFSSKAIEKLVRTALTADFADPLPESVLKRNGLCDLQTAIRHIHFPQSAEALERAKRRLVFEELFLLQTTLLLMKEKKRALSGNVIRRDYTGEFQKLLPFELTGAQQRAIRECAADLSCERMMNRLLQGDVGSGKTAVAAALIYSCAKNGYQSALMAPTEILAEQHYATLCSFFKGTDVRCVLLTGSAKKREKDAAKAALRDGTVSVAVGTHALLTEDVEFRSLALAITDEQHRFGVDQRAKLSGKGKNPHTLVMSATPIPRTLAMMLYGDLDISILDEYPKGRQKVESYCVDQSYHERLYRFVQKQLDEGRQAYIVCPLVEDGEEPSDLQSAETYFETLRTGAFANYRVGLLHGKMNARDKDSVMRDFKNGEIRLLVCTTVVEVGVDVPNASVMIIENAERFGLSQLHQLRGRIGRGPYASTCVFVSAQNSSVTAERLKVICKTNDGFYIAEEDLKLRGPGDFLGRRQHGLPEFRIADLSSDMNVLRLAGSEARELLAADPKLNAHENAALRREVRALYRKMHEN